jgi:hypothetical protein
MSGQSLPTVFAKLAAHFKTLRAFTERAASRYFDRRVILPILEAVEDLIEELRTQRSIVRTQAQSRS